MGILQMTMYKPKVYTASKAHYRILWIKMAEDIDWDFVEFTASWPRDPFIEQGTDDAEVDPDYLRSAWSTNLSEIANSDFLLVFGKPSDPIKGTVFETGFAVGRGIPVLLVGELAPTHSWKWAQQIRHFASLREARDYLYKFTTMVPRKRKGNPDAEA